MPRLFTGLEIPPSVAQSLAMMRGGLPGARWIDPENYHITLRFIGDIDGALAREIAGMLGRVHRRPFELRINGLASFGGVSYPIWTDSRHQLVALPGCRTGLAMEEVFTAAVSSKR